MTRARVPSLIAGQWTSGCSDRHGSVHNPSTGEVIAETPFCTPDDVQRAVESAHTAFPAWAETPVVDRARVMFRFRELLERHLDELAAIVTREHGKNRSEAKAGILRGIEVVEFACGIPSLITGSKLPNIARDVDIEAVRHPLGVCVGITPFNFPAMVPLWMFPIALVCGNAFILKPSEKVPLTAVRLGELLLEAGLPPGVFQIAHGDKVCVDALLTHPLVKAISFVGSSPVAKSIYETGTRYGKRVQAAGGAKNHVLIMSDADLDQAVAALSTAAYGCAGERCMAASVAVPIGSVADDFVARMCAQANSLSVGPTDSGQAVDVGPLITGEHRDRVASSLDTAAQEGARVVCDGRPRGQSLPGFFLGPSVVDHVTPAMRVGREELFGPVLSVMRVDSLEAAIEIGAHSPYGNGASLFTRSGWAAREFQRRFPAGMIGINVGVPAPMAWFPFTGWNGSFFGDLHIQGVEGMQFYTQHKVTLSRWFQSANDSAQDAIWRSSR
jgi:malonate-semialdehyde dehydrogenase (acetylating)/methylmalonate-semialdehyde dehydrogenase